MYSAFTKILIAVFLLASVAGLSEAQIVREGAGLATGLSTRIPSRATRSATFGVTTTVR